MTIFVNRTLNLKSIKAIGFDMDYTLVRYQHKAFEQLTYDEMIKKLLTRGYPEKIKNLKFDINQTIRGLTVDREEGNLIKLDAHGRIKTTFHGTKQLEFKKQQALYRAHSVDLSEDRYSSIDTTFSIAYGAMFCQLVDLKDQFPNELPSYPQIEEDALWALDISHRDDSLKSAVRNNLEKYIIQDQDTPKMLERFKKYGKKLWLITNSDFAYTKVLLEYTIDPFLKEHKNWEDLFDLVVTSSSKPSFFMYHNRFLKIDTETGLMSNSDGPFTKGVFQSGNAQALQDELGCSGDQILYLGDHIYGDILSLKKTCNWRTALVIEELVQEVSSIKEGRKINDEIEALMQEKINLEKILEEFYVSEFEFNQNVSEEEKENHIQNIKKLDEQLSQLIIQYHKLFNPYWGEVMRSGQTPSRFASQVEKYACVYMSKVSDLLDYSPRTYFRPSRRSLPHEL